MSEPLLPCPACGKPAEQITERLVMCSDYACSFSCSLLMWQKIGSVFAERDRYHSALEAIGTFSESPDWEHDYWSDDIGSHLDCVGRARVREMVEEALEAAKPGGAA